MAKRKVADEKILAQVLEMAQQAYDAWPKLDDALKAQVIATLQAAAIGPDGWPRVYVNSETGRVYKPHNDAERSVVFSDTPRYILVRGGEGGGKSVAGIIKTLERVRRGMSGLMACVAPETMIEGMPIGDRKHPAPVTTLWGRTWASSGICEGKADLFRVVTESGQEVVVTKNHRFLTPLGWRQLRSLRVGALIAAGDTSCAGYSPERESGSQGCCWPDSRPYLHFAPELRWVQISSISFEKYGEFWDLSVPGPQHYFAHNLLHHNSPNLPHYKRSLWPEFRRWCPWERVTPKHQRFGKLDWEPHEPFNIVFRNDAVLHCTGIENPGSLEGPNISFAHFDEARHHPDAKALKVLDGRVRIPGPKGEMPQIYLTTTPSLNWLYEYFGPPIEDDPYAAFKKDAKDIVLLTKDNEANLFDGFAQTRAQTLTEREARVLLEAAWEDLTEGQPFLPDITWWDNCQEKLPPLSPREPLVLGVDAATGRTASSSDCFAITGVTRHPESGRAGNAVAVRYAKIWQAKAGQKIDYRGTPDDPGPERELLRLCGYELSADGVPVPSPRGGHNVLTVVYDPTELHDMASRLYKRGVSWFQEFSQGKQREEADRQLLDLIREQRIAHDGNADLRDHMRNADRKTDESGHRLRIVKRTDTQKVDLAVALSMASYEAMRLNL